MSPVASETLGALAGEYWERVLAWNPLTATLVGDRRFDHLMPDLSPEALALQVTDLAELAERVRAVDPSTLTADERVTRLQLLALARDGMDERTTGFETWNLDPMDGPQVALLSLPSWHTVRYGEGPPRVVGTTHARHAPSAQPMRFSSDA